jgi:hypothetical protein
MVKLSKIDTTHTIKFLRTFHEADDPWHLIAINKELDPAIIAKTFHPNGARKKRRHPRLRNAGGHLPI